MYFVIDVIASADRPRVIQFWQKQLHQLRRQRGFVAAEFFQRDRDIRNADYDFLTVLQWQSGDDCRQALWQGVLPQNVPGQTIERAHYEVVVELAEAQSATDNSSWLINPFEISREQMPDVLDMWDKAKDHMQAKTGFEHARLFRSVQDDVRYGLVNVAQWSDAESFMAALNDNAYDAHKQRSLQYRLHPSLCKRLCHVRAIAHTETSAA